MLCAKAKRTCYRQRSVATPAGSNLVAAGQRVQMSTKPRTRTSNLTACGKWHLVSPASYCSTVHETFAQGWFRRKEVFFRSLLCLQSLYFPPPRNTLFGIGLDTGRAVAYECRVGM